MSQQNYVVIGGTKGIGAALVQQLSNAGHHVIYTGRAETSNTPPNTTYLPYQATATEPLQPLPEAIHGLVYCPGSINLKPFHRLSDQEYIDDYQLNVLGAIRVVKQCLKPLKKAGNASIVLFSTVAVGQGMPFHASVAAAKGAVEGLTRSLAAELAPGIRVNAVAPSITDTPLAARLLGTDEKRAASAQRHPLKAVGTAEQIAGMAAFLLSPQAAFITGQVVGVDGGMSAIRPL